MDIRVAQESDIPQIVGLLKASLGESLMPKSEEYWRWKHIRNPFGPSPVLLCFERDELIGVRAFMRWEWRDSNRKYTAVRAVDTATHPAHQGKGIFRKLTMALLDKCKDEGVDFVYNTPNDQSKPGYLKMGWEVAGKLPVRVGIDRPLDMALSALKLKTARILNGTSNLADVLARPDLPAVLAHHLGNSSGIMTNLSVPYLKWRYIDVPVAKYLAITEDSENGEMKSLAIARLKSSTLGNELRITDVISGKGASRKGISPSLKSTVKITRTSYITQTVTPDILDIAGLSMLKVKYKNGPTVTIRNLNLGNLSDLRNFRQWRPSTGDLELF
jgi:GNAT superfamily N-acetyltransferase